MSLDYGKVRVSDGDPTPGGILGAKSPHPFDGTDNTTFEIILNPGVAGLAHDREREWDDD